MIVIKTMVSQGSRGEHMTVYADAVSELPSDGMISGKKVAPGSVAYDKAGNVSICDSNGTWNAV